MKNCRSRKMPKELKSCRRISARWVSYKCIFEIRMNCGIMTAVHGIIMVLMNRPKKKFFRGTSMRAKA